MLNTKQLALLDLLEGFEAILLDVVCGDADVCRRLLNGVSKVLQLFEGVDFNRLPVEVRSRLTNLELIKKNLAITSQPISPMSLSAPESAAKEIISLYGDLIATAHRWKN